MRLLLSVLLITAGCVKPTPTCTDGAWNGEESDVDCGGPSCEPCVLSRACVTHQDCKSVLCVKRTCVPGSCQDGRVSGGESGVDCGRSEERRVGKECA